jgi:hypothetical protein
MTQLAVRDWLSKEEAGLERKKIPLPYLDSRRLFA